MNDTSDFGDMGTKLGQMISVLALMIILTAAMVGIGFLIMMRGWGVQPESWGWILGGTAAQYVLLLAIQCFGAVMKNA